MVPRRRLSLLAPLAFVALAGTARSEGVRILQAPGLGLLPDIQTAVDAAADGDTLIVASGVYPPFDVNDRSLWIVASEAGTVTVTGTITVRNTTKKDVVVMIGIEATGLPQDLVADPGLRLDDNNGHLRFQQCAFTGGKGTLVGPGSLERGAGGAGVFAFDNKRVSLVRCALQGGLGGGKDGLNLFDTGGPGGPGMYTEQSTVVLYDSTGTGGVGGAGGSIGGDGGHGCEVFDFGVVAANTDFVGARGGYAWDVLPYSGGNGGDALHVGAGGQAQLVDNFYVRGNPGGACCGGSPGASGLVFGGAGVFNEHSVPARSFQAEYLASDGELWRVASAVAPGDVAFLFWALEPAFKLPSPVWGMWLALQPTMATYPAAPFGKPHAPPNLSQRLPNLQGKSHLPMYWQGAVREGGTLQPCSPVHVLVFDRQGLPDCDGDGVNDYVALFEGLKQDCNENLLPDSCDIAALTSADCNQNGVPDECDIAAGASPDLNGNGIPDECEAMNVVWYVDDDAAPGGNGSAASPFQAIGDGVAVALSGDTVLVADGTYTGPNNKDMDFGGRDLIVVSANGPAACVIDLQQLGRAFLILGGETEAARVEGFTIRNGDGSGPPNWGWGGGMYVQNASPTIAGCVFESCAASRGGALYVIGVGTTRITDCTFSNNTASDRGGAFYGSGGPRFVDGCRFVGNSGSLGGAVSVSGYATSPVTITHCEFLGNTATSEGGGVDYFSTGNTLSGISECLFAGNSAARGGGVHAFGTDATFSGLTIVDNSSTITGGGLTLGGFDLRVVDSVLWGNTAPGGRQISIDLSPASGNPGDLYVDYCCVQGGPGQVFIDPGGDLHWGVGNLEDDPLFVAPGSDYRLGPGSPCVDAGDNTAVAPDQLDLNGNANTTEPVPFDLDFLPRFRDDPAVPDTGNGPPPIVDMGAYEKQG